MAEYATSKYLQHHFDSWDQQRESTALGMWLFLVTEIMFFGGLFVAYVIYRMHYPVAAQVGSHELDITLGAINTAVLIGSSVTMAMAVKMSQLGRRKAIVWFLLATVVLGSVFLGIKVVEYNHKFHQNHFPGEFAGYQYEFADLDHAIAAANVEPEEAVGVTRRLLDGETVDHHGPHYTFNDLRHEPHPIQRHLPIAIGGWPIHQWPTCRYRGCSTLRTFAAAHRSSATRPRSVRCSIR